jgi:C-terminal processing protease CtpA/Prc
MYYQKVLFVFCLFLLSFDSIAEKPIKIGVTWGVTASGFFSPEIDEIIAKKILANSPAEKAGLKVGDKVISIEDCNIPGCAASKANAYLESDSGSKLHFVVKNKDGEIENIIITVG